MPEKLIVGISDSESQFANYPRWMEELPEVEVRVLKPGQEQEVVACDGLILSGGVDSHPRFYGSEVLDYPLAPAVFDEVRDRFELEIFRLACEQDIPVLAICRGMQLVNIALGGDMIQDLETAGYNNHRKMEGKDGVHPVQVKVDSVLNRIAGLETVNVNSAHHQGLGRMAGDLEVIARSPDGVAEAVVWKAATGKNALLGVQWHPERLEGLLPGNPMGNGIRKWFLEAMATRKSRR